MSARDVPPPVQMVQLLAGFQISQALYAVAVLGVADHLSARPVPVEVLAGQAGAHAPSLRRLLRTLAGAGVFTEPEPGVFGLTPLGQTLTRTRPGSMRDLAIMWMETHYAPFGELVHTVRTGQPAAGHLYGQPFFAWLAGQERAEDQWHDLLSTAGFAGIGIRETGTPLSVIHATVAG